MTADDPVLTNGVTIGAGSWARRERSKKIAAPNGGGEFFETIWWHRGIGTIRVCACSLSSAINQISSVIEAFASNPPDTTKAANTVTKGLDIRSPPFCC